MMKKIMILMMGLMALCANAQDRFYIEDFTVTPGETRDVSILLDNEIAYTAFQADLYLPEGLTIEQEDDEYIFDLTSRKARDHNIASQVQMDGAIRVMSYSPGIKAYSGNSGPLVTFSVIADEDFKGPAYIQMKTILLITASGQEIPFADEQCTVTISSSSINGDVDGNGHVDIDDVTAMNGYILNGNATGIDTSAADCDGDGKINIDDLTFLIDMLLSGGN